MPKIKSKKYYSFLDLIKAFAIFFVVFYHSFCAYINPSFSSFFDYPKYFVYSLLGMGVPLFFMVNGFLLFQKDCNLKKHVLKMVKIIAITGIWAVFTLTLLMLIRGDSFALSGFVKDLISLKQGYINHLWFMEALVFIYVLFPFFKWIYDKYFAIFKVIFLFVVIYTLLIPTYCVINDSFYKLPFSGVLNNLPSVYFFFSLSYFTAGGILYKIFSSEKLKKMQFIITIVVTSLLLIIHTFIGISKSKQMDSVFDNAWACYASAFIFAAVFLIFLVLHKHLGDTIPGIIKKIGTDSLAIYFIHPIVIAIVMIIPGVKKMCHSFILNFIFSMLILLFSFLSAELLKKVPIIKNLVQL